MKAQPNDPINAHKHLNCNGQIEEQYKGLTKREYFAAIAMQGLLAGHYEYFTGNADVSVPSEVAKYAVLNANALIDELNNQ